MSRSKRKFIYIYEQTFRHISNTNKLKQEIRTVDDLKDNCFVPSNRHKARANPNGKHHVRIYDDLHFSVRPKEYTANVDRQKEAYNFVYERSDLFDIYVGEINIQVHLLNLLNLFAQHQIHYQVDYDPKYSDIEYFTGLRFLLTSKYIYGYLDLEHYLAYLKSLNRNLLGTKSFPPRTLYFTKKNYFDRYSDCLFQLPMPLKEEELDILFNFYLPLISKKNFSVFDYNFFFDYSRQLKSSLFF